MKKPKNVNTVCVSLGEFLVSRALHAVWFQVRSSFRVSSRLDSRFQQAVDLFACVLDSLALRILDLPFGLGCLHKRYELDQHQHDCL